MQYNAIESKTILVDIQNPCSLPPQCGCVTVSLLCVYMSISVTVSLLCLYVYISMTVSMLCVYVY